MIESGAAAAVAASKSSGITATVAPAPAANRGGDEAGTLVPPPPPRPTASSSPEPRSGEPVLVGAAPSTTSPSASSDEKEEAGAGASFLPLPSWGPSMRLAASSALERALAERLGQQNKVVRASYRSERAKNFGDDQGGKIRLTVEESNLLLNGQEQLYVCPRTNNSCCYWVDGTAAPLFPPSSTAANNHTSLSRCLFFLAACSVGVAAAAKNEDDREGEGEGEGDLPSPSSSTASVVVFVPPPDADPSAIDQVGHTLGRLLGYLSLALVGVDEVHLVSIADEGESTEDDRHAVLEYFQESLGPKMRGKSRVHLVHSRGEVSAALEARGMMREDLPARFGGKLTRHQTSAFLIQRSGVCEADDDDDANDMEDEEAPASATAPSDIAPRSQAARPGRQGSAADDNEDVGASPSNPRASTAASAAANTQEFIRKRNAVYARRKYARRKIEVEVLKEQRHDLEKQRQRLQAEHRRLTGLLAQAENCVDHIIASGGVVGGVGAGGSGGAGAAALTLTHLLPPGSFRGPSAPTNPVDAHFADVKRVGSGDQGAGHSSATSASRRTRLLLMEQLRLQDQLAVASSSSASTTNDASMMVASHQHRRGGGGGPAVTALPESPTATTTTSSSRRYLESLHGYAPPLSSSHGGGRGGADRRPQGGGAAAEPPHHSSSNLTLQLALLHRQQELQQHQEQMNALRAAANAGAPPLYSPPYQDLSQGGGGNLHQHPQQHPQQQQQQHHHPSLVAELLWLQRDLELQNQQQGQLPPPPHRPEERNSLSPAPYPWSR